MLPRGSQRGGYQQRNWGGRFQDGGRFGYVVSHPTLTHSSPLLLHSPYSLSPSLTHTLSWSLTLLYFPILLYSFPFSFLFFPAHPAKLINLATQPQAKKQGIFCGNPSRLGCGGTNRVCSTSKSFIYSSRTRGIVR